MLALLPLLFPSAVAAEQVTVIGGLSQELNLGAGARREGVLGLRNNTDAPLDVLLTQRDYTFQSTGRTDYPEPGSMAQSNAPWVSLGQTQVRLPPGEVTEVAWTVAAPAGVDDGTYWSVVMIEPMGDRFAPKAAGRAVGVTTVYRSAVQLVTHIGRPAAELGFVGHQLERTPEGNTLLAVDVGNQGRGWAVPTVWTELARADGGDAQAEAGPRRLFPGTSARYWLDLGVLPAGTHEAVVVIDAGGDDVIGTRVPVVVE